MSLVQDTSIVQSVGELFDRDLGKLHDELEAYQNDWLMWVKEKNVKESGGELCIQLIFLLEYYIGEVLGEETTTGLNFPSRENHTREMLLDRVRRCRLLINHTFAKLEGQTLQDDYPVRLNGVAISTFLYLMHLCAQTNYLLGQITYHRKLV